MGTKLLFLSPPKSFLGTLTLGQLLVRYKGWFGCLVLVPLCLFSFKCHFGCNTKSETHCHRPACAFPICPDRCPPIALFLGQRSRCRDRVGGERLGRSSRSSQSGKGPFSSLSFPWFHVKHPVDFLASILNVFLHPFQRPSVQEFVHRGRSRQCFVLFE